MTNLYDLTVDAAHKIDTYRYPDIDAWLTAILPILNEYGCNTCQAEIIDVIFEDDKYIAIKYRDEHSDFHIIAIDRELFFSDDPLEFAKRINKERKIRDLEYHINNKQVSIANLSSQLSDEMRQLKRLNDRLKLLHYS